MHRYLMVCLDRWEPEASSHHFVRADTVLDAVVNFFDEKTPDDVRWYEDKIKTVDAVYSYVDVGGEQDLLVYKVFHHLT